MTKLFYDINGMLYVDQNALDRMVRESIFPVEDTLRRPRIEVPAVELDLVEV